MELPVNQILNGDALTHLKEFPDQCINMVMTSPPYWALRDYGIDGQLGLEETYKEFIDNLCDVFDEVKRILKDEGVIFVNIGDTYYGSGKGVGTDPKKMKESYVLLKGWNRPSRQKFSETGIDKNCLICGKEIKKGVNGQFCSRKCLNTKGNDFRSQNRLLPDKCLTLIPFRFAIEMVNRGWILRNIIIWHKPNAMPSSVKDRFGVDFEYIFFFSKNKRYYFKQQFEPHKTEGSYEPFNKRVRDVVAGRIALDQYKASENEINSYKKHSLRAVHGGKTNVDYRNPEGRNKRTTWFIPVKPFTEAHFATYPEELCETPISAGCPEGGIVLDMFFGSGTTGLVALKQNKKFIGIELNPEYIEIAKKRLQPYLEQTQLNYAIDEQGVKHET